MKTFLASIIALSFLSLTLPMSALAQQPSAFDLDTFRWTNRVLLVFAPASSDTRYLDLEQQIERRRQDFEERDMLLIAAFAGEPGRAGEDVLLPAAASTLRERFKVSERQFRIFLIGKDGGVKLQKEQRVGLDEFFSLIDTMPMRKREMQRQP